MRLKKIDSQEASAVHIAKVILFVGTVNIVENSVIFVSLVEGHLLTSLTHLHIIARSL